MSDWGIGIGNWGLQITNPYIPNHLHLQLRFFQRFVADGSQFLATGVQGQRLFERQLALLQLGDDGLQFFVGLLKAHVQLFGGFGILFLCHAKNVTA